MKAHQPSEISTSNWNIVNCLSVPVFTCLFALNLVGCSPTPALKTLDEAHQKFIQLCKDEYKMDVHLTPVDNTLWIYVPRREPIIDIKASGTGIKQSDEGKVDYHLNYLDAHFKNGAFVIRYDIAQQINYPKEYGYTSQYTEEFTQKYHGIYQAIYRSYGGIEEVPGEHDFADPHREAQRDRLIENHIRRIKPPEFIGIIFADIVKGIEVKIIVNFEDLKKEFAGAIAMEESPLRRINEISGNKNIIGDKTGRYLDKKAIRWEDFLSRQIVNRINFTYTQSSKEVRQNPQELLSEQAAVTINTYGFDEYSSVQLVNLRTDGPLLVLNKSNIKQYDIRKTTPQANVLKYEIGGVKEGLPNGY